MNYGCYEKQVTALLDRLFSRSLYVLILGIKSDNNDKCSVSGELGRFVSLQKNFSQINITKSVEAESPQLVNVSPKAEQLSETTVGQGASKCNPLGFNTFFVPIGVED